MLVIPAKAGIQASLNLSNLTFCNSARHACCLDAGLRQNDELEQLFEKIALSWDLNIKPKSHAA